MAISLELHNFFLSLSFFSPSTLTWAQARQKSGHSPLSAAPLLPSSSRLTWVITEDGLSITSRSGPECWPHSLKLGDCSPTPRCMKLRTCTEKGASREEGEKNPRRSPHHNTHGTRSPITRPFHVGGGVRRSEARKSSRLESCAEEMPKVLIQYGAQLRSAISRYKHGGFKASHST